MKFGSMKVRRVGMSRSVECAACFDPQELSYRPASTPNHVKLLLFQLHTQAWEGLISPPTC